MAKVPVAELAPTAWLARQYLAGRRGHEGWAARSGTGCRSTWLGPRPGGRRWRAPHSMLYTWR